MLATTPKPPYYAVIFTSLRTQLADGYGQTAALMEELAQQQPGFLGIESARNPPGLDATGITVSYWDSLETIRNWKQQADHRIAQATGRQHWYETYQVRICRVERAYEFSSANPSTTHEIDSQTQAG